MKRNLLKIERQIAWEKLQRREERLEWDVLPWLESCQNAHADFVKLSAGRFIEHSMGVSDWPALSTFSNLAYYGLFGDFLNTEETGDPNRYLDTQIEYAERIHTTAPYKCDDRVVLKIISVAKARRNIERQVGFVEPLALAVFAGVSEGRIRNLMSGNDATLNSVDGRIFATNAEPWLRRRAAYWPSIWNNEMEVEDETPDKVRVPQASDGTVFHPGLRRRSGYMVGEKGSEVTVENFSAALSMLGEMRTPRWRRPNSKGNWGIVTAIGWVTLSQRDLNHIKE